VSIIYTQIEMFVFTLILGILTGLIFHLYQLLIKRARVSKFLGYFLDFTVWLFILLLVFVAMLWINEGEMRIYVLIAILAGVFLYYRLCSSYLQAGLTSTANVIVTVMGNLKRPINLVLHHIKRWIKPTQGPPPDSEN